MVNSETGDTFAQKNPPFLGSFSFLPLLGRAVADSEGEQMSLQYPYFFQLHHRVAVDELG